VPLPATPRFYAYLTADFRQLRMALESLVNARLPGSVHIKRLTPTLRQYLVERGIEVLDRAPPLEQAVARASVVIHHGGIATTMAALGMGRPQMLWPHVTDQFVTARAVEQLRVGEAGVRTARSGPDASPALRRIAEDQEMARTAQELAQRLARRHARGSLEIVLAKARALLAG